jgi:hypothetical protein
MASFCVESFSVDRLANLSEKEIARRFRSSFRMSGSKEVAFS